MPDPRFYEALGPVTLADLATLTGAELSDPAASGRLIEGAAPLARADASSVSFLADRRYLADLRQTEASACFVAPAHVSALPQGCVALTTPEPQAAYAQAANRLHRSWSHPEGTPAIHPSVKLEDEVVLGHNVVIGPGAMVGAGTVIGSNTVIGPGVAIGRRCRIGSNVVIGFALIGDRVRILSGAIIGEPGFGVAGAATGVMDIPQLGRVILQDDVTIGACTCIDRGAFDDTALGERTKVDNLVQIAHNVRIGCDCVLAAHTGISGSVVVGDRAMFGGRAGIADHLEIGAGARIAAASGVMRNVPAGEIWCGTPARPLRKFMRETAWLTKQAEGRTDSTGARDE